MKFSKRGTIRIRIPAISATSGATAKVMFIVSSRQGWRGERSLRAPSYAGIGITGEAEPSIQPRGVQAKAQFDPVLDLYCASEHRKRDDSEVRLMQREGPRQDDVVGRRFDSKRDSRRTRLAMQRDRDARRGSIADALDIGHANSRERIVRGIQHAAEHVVTRARDVFR